jgi:hypothetical protein
MKEIVRYAVIDEEGDFVASFPDENEARGFDQSCTIVKLTGQMTEPKRMKKVATYLYRDDSGRVFHAHQLLTEDAAKQECEKYGVTLFLWPYGDVIEVEEKC